MTIAVDVDEKRWSTLQAEAAIAKCVARRYAPEDGRGRYSISRWDWPPRFFTSIAGAEAFLRRMEGRG